MITITATSVVVGNLVSANGGGNIAGGSGGSILIYTNTFSGSGTISANGGTGSSGSSGCSVQGGGGSGGRIAVHFYQSNFTGAMTSFGGLGYSNAYGGPGTVFTKDYTAGYTTLAVSNNNFPMFTTTITSMPATMGSVAWITETDVIIHRIDEIRIGGQAGLTFEPIGIAKNYNVSLFISC